MNKEKLEKIFDKFATSEEKLAYKVKKLKDKTEELKQMIPDKGNKGDKGDKGDKGSPDTPEEIRDKLLTLQGEKRLDASAIKNLPKPSTKTEVMWGGYGSHDILSLNHGDITTGVVVRGDLITGQGATPTWTKLAIGADGTYLKSDGTDISWANVDGCFDIDINGNLEPSETINEDNYFEADLANDLMPKLA